MDYLWSAHHQILNESAADSKSDQTAVNGSEFAAHINKLILTLYGNFLSNDGKTVDYVGLSKSEEFKKFQMELKKLKQVRMEDLNKTELKAFFLNIYNVLMIHGQIVRGVPNGMWQKTKFFREISYQIGPYVYSLDDIEHGILSGNRKHPNILIRKTLASDDPRLHFIVQEFDPRVHFALVCGSKSCPPIRIYKPENLDFALNAAVTAFCNDDSNVQINLETKQVHLSQIFEWYLTDFATTEKELLQYIAQYLEGDKQKQLMTLLASDHFVVSHLKYDWSVNGNL